ncbi:MAG: hypothetical protein BGP10_14620 [Rhodanobacter sp. 68-29]|nr:diguanylate cyclase [Rhodanobacter sp.]ODU72711.1 MAG: hypothetical protein ABT17_15155 [Rhodanobacter sp. SCN 69-32]OJY61166.1 MAG: hypothetical protein BGP10_14620 [Rhodanobacter sp. 68-29]
MGEHASIHADTRTAVDLLQWPASPLATHYGTADTQASEMAAAAAFIERLAYPACLVDATGIVTGLNAAWRGFAPLAVEAATQQWAQLIHPADRYEAFSHLHALCVRRQSTSLECRLANRHGLPDWFLLQLQSFNTPSASVFYLCTCTDIRHLKRTEVELRRRASMQADMLDISVDCIKLIALDGTLVHMNKAGCRALGVPEDSSFGMPWLALLPEDVRARGERELEQARAGKFGRFPGRSVLPGGKTQYWDNMLTPVLSADGSPSAILCVSREVTLEKEALGALQASEQRLAIAARIGGLGIWDYDVVQQTWQCDEAWHGIMGLDALHPVRFLDQFRPLIHPDDLEAADDYLRALTESTSEAGEHVLIFRIVRPDGEGRWLRSAAHVQHENARVVRVVGFIVDITDAWRNETALRNANRALELEKSSLERRCLEDPLTGLPNRRLLNSAIEHLCMHAAEARTPFCIGMVDIDHFKALNDRYGHLYGDAALSAIASAMQSVMRQSDFIARYGGEEFAFVLADGGEPQQVLDRLFEAVDALAIVHADSPNGHVTISCGCLVVRSANKVAPDDILRMSDCALYAAKTSGRHRYVIQTFG